MGENQNRKKNHCKYSIMKEAIKFSILAFGLATLFFLIEYIFVPGAYNGENLLLIWAYLLNILIGVVLFPLFYLFITRLGFIGKLGYILIYFILFIIVTNIVPFVSEHIVYTSNLIKSIVNEERLQLNIFLELLNPILGFVLACFLMRRSNLWNSSKK